MDTEIKIKTDACPKCSAKVEFPEYEEAKFDCPKCGEALYTAHYETKDEATGDDCSFFYIGRTNW